MNARQRLMFDGAAKAITAAADLIQSKPETVAQWEIVIQFLTDAKVYLAQFNEELRRIGP